MRQALEPQDWLTTVVELEPGANIARVHDRLRARQRGW
jgi:mannitol 2-dehydrogenase